MSFFKKIVLIIWFILLWLIWFYYFKNPDFFTKDWLYNFFQNFWNYIIIAYIIFSCFRWIFLLPSTVLIFVWALFLDPINLFLISMWAIIFSSSLVYFFGDFLWLDKEIKNPKYTKKIKLLEEKINKNGYFIVSIWSFTPFVPTDLICYVAWTTKMNYLKFIFWVITWETPLVLIYVLVAFWIINFF